MAKDKQYVFSARTTQEGLAALNELKLRLGVGWDELVIDAVCGHYNLNKSALMLPRAEVDSKTTVTDEAKPKAEPKQKPKAKKAKGKASSTVVMS